MIVNVYKLQQIMSFVVLAAVIVAGVQCSNHVAEKRVMLNNDGGPLRIKAQSRISMSKGGYGARVQIREDLHGRKHAHAMAICDCNGQGPWRPLFKPSQILKTEFPEHESFHEEVDTQYRNIMGDHVDNHLRLPHTSQSSEHLSTGPDSGGFSGGGISYNGGGYDGSGSGGSGGSSAGAGGPGLPKKHNHMIHLHLIPHIYVPVMHSAGFSEAKNYHATVEDGSPLSSPVQNSADTSSEFQVGDVAAAGGPGQTGTSGSGENPTSASVTAGATGDHDHGNFNGHSGESSYYTISDDAVQHLHQDLHDHYGNGIDNHHNHDYEVPSNSVPEEPHQYQVHEVDDLSKDYSNKNHVTSLSSTVAGKPSAHHNHHPQHKHRSPVAKPNRGKHGRKLSSRQDLKNLLVMRPPPMGQTQTWRYVYRPAMAGHHQQYYQGKQQLPVIKTRTVPVILHIRQRSDDD